ncbi:MAG: SagB/ThcOx family dehydrogenase [Limnochordia bacterium]|nr:SagB/ThcOx family dehydrogenase [Limnochordia bacterium]
MSSIGKTFMEKTKFRYLDESDQDKGLPQPPLELGCPADAVLVDLPRVDQIKVRQLDLTVAMGERKTMRKYGSDQLSLDELAYLLWYTQGVKRITPRPVTLRTVPSAGARHAFETYLLINKVKDLAPGLYKYVALEHKLMVVDLQPRLAEKVSHSAANQVFINDSAVTFIWTAELYRMKWRYGERSYRYIHLDAGHVCQNLYLAAQAVQSGVCAIAAFDDDELNSLLGIDGDQHFAVYLATVGKL